MRFILIGMLFTGCAASSSAPPSTLLTGAYLGRLTPQPKVSLFAPDLVSTGLDERDTAWSPNGRYLLFTVRSKGVGTIVMFERTRDRWDGPRVAPFSGRYSDLEPAFSPDGSQLYFASNRPKTEGAESKDYDLWVLPVTEAGFGPPENLGVSVNTDADEYYPSVTKDGTLYFTAVYETGLGKDDLYRAAFVNGTYQKPEMLSEPVNSASYEFNAFVAPDESYLIFSALGRAKEQGGGDLVVSFRTAEGGWTEPKNLGEDINTPGLDFCPAVTPDGTYLFFTRRFAEPRDSKTALRYTDLVRAAQAPQNGLGDIYVVSAKRIEALRPK